MTAERLRLLLVPFVLGLVLLALFLSRLNPAAPIASPAPSAAPSELAAGAVDDEALTTESVLLALRERVDVRELDPAISTKAGPELIRELEASLGTWQVKRAFEQSVYALLADRAIARGEVSVSEAEIEELYAREEQAFLASPDGERFGTYAEFLERSGRSVEFRKEELRRERGLDRLLGEPPEAELREEFETLRDHFSGREVQLRHILVDSASEARRILKELEGGADFARLARSSSQEASTAKRGGRVAWIKRRGDVPEALAALAFRLEVGKPGGPVNTLYGWHVVQVDAERNAKEVDFSSTRDELLGLVKKRRRVAHMKSERARAKVVSPWGDESEKR